ncbi:MAG: DUF4331 domain-containing protein [Acidimicrobiales bacterium]
MSLLKKFRIPALLGVGIVAASLVPSGASSHREAPLIAQDPVADNTDVYAFRSPDRPDSVTLVSNWIPFEEPAGGPNFYNFGDDVLYQIHVDNNADAEPDITYEWRFTTEIQNPNTFLYSTGPITSINDPDFNYRQFYNVTVVRNGVRTTIGSHLPVPPNNIGPRSTPNYEAVAAQGVHTLGTAKSFAGQRDDPFFLDSGSAFDLLGLRPFNTAHVIPRATEAGVDGLGGFNIHTIAIQVPISELTAPGNPIIGVYSQTKRQQTRVLSPTGPGSKPLNSGAFVNVSRLGMPLVNEIIIPLGQKDRFNASEPRDDAQFLPRVQNPEPGRLLPGLYPGVTVPPAPRADLVAIFLTGLPGLNQVANGKPSEMIRLNTSTPVTGSPNAMGVLAGDNQGFPNGRRLADDIVDIELRALAGATPFTPPFNRVPNNSLCDGVNANDRAFLGAFPYVATPHQGYEHTHHKVGSTSPQPPGPVVTSPPTSTPPTTATPPTSTPPTTTPPTTTPVRCDYPESYKQFLTAQQISTLTAAGFTFCGAG